VTNRPETWSQAVPSELCVPAEYHLPATPESVTWLHKDVALPMMQRPEQLAQAYGHLVHANALHQRIYESASSEVVYHMACCLSLGAGHLAVAMEAGRGDVAPDLPPVLPGAPAKEVIEARLDCAEKALGNALELGFSDVARLQFAPQLRALRDRRPAEFGDLLQRVLIDLGP